ncbi:MAG: hypothetical protein JRK53_18755 [Deltaproteobacteria bacterium]|nr:hypothetical protein [Deltaproteobacteria bacterium]
MDKKRNERMEISYPMWLIIFIAFCGIGTILMVTYYIVLGIYNGKIFSNLLILTFITVSWVLINVWFLLKIVFYSVIATSKGIKSNNLIGPDKFFPWDEILEVRKPIYGIPPDAIYVISKDNEKLMLLRGMKNIDEFIQLIKEKAPNLKRCQI